MKLTIKMLALVLVLAMIAPSVAAASVEIAQPFASSYIQSYSVYLVMDGNTVKTTFRVYGTTILADVGVKEIILQQSPNGTTGWTDVATYLSSDPQYAASMMGHNRVSFYSNVPYANGISGYYYRAQVTVYCGDGTNGDSRTTYTTVKQL